MASLEFVLVSAFMKDLLKIIQAATKSLQAREIGYNVSMSLIRAVLTHIILKQQSCWKAEIPQNRLLLKIAQFEIVASQQCWTILLLNILWENEVNWTGKLKFAFYETIDIVTIEMTNPFEKNDAILTAEKMDFSKLLPLTALSIELPNEIELQIAKNDKLNDLKKPGCVKNDQTLFHSLA